MYVRSIDIRAFRHLRNVRIGPLPEPSKESNIQVLAGPNGGGKSSVLELLGYALSSSWSVAWSINRSFPAAAFQIELGLTTEECSTLRDYNTAHPQQYLEEGVDQVMRTKGWTRSYNYDSNVQLENSVHAFVTGCLRNEYGRSLGFFVRSDRGYPQRGFSQSSIFQFAQMRQRDHLWGTAFNTAQVQYDSMFDYLVQLRYHYLRQLGAYYERPETASQGTRPVDPLAEYDQLLARLFSGYRFDTTDEEIPTNLWVRLPSGELVQFSDLSSGEKEVFFLLSFFMRHSVSNAVIAIDEPELHLHAELSRVLIREMLSIRPGNQLWVGTHNPEVIDEAGRDRVVFIQRDPVSFQAVAIPGSDEPAAAESLRRLFGYSGFIGVAHSLVFLEGEDSSADRKLLSRLLPSGGERVKFVPYGTSGNLPKLNAAVLEILQSGLGSMRLYLLRDRDYMTSEQAGVFSSHPSGRIYVWQRYHVENYLLEDQAIASVQTNLFEKAIDPAAVRGNLRRLALSMSGETLAGMVSFQLNNLVHGPSMDLGNILRNQTVLTDDLDWQEERIAAISERTAGRFAELETKVSNWPGLVDAQFKQCRDRLLRGFESEGWRDLVPGRRLLEAYCKDQDLGRPIILQNAIIKEFAAHPNEQPAEFSEVLKRIGLGANLDNTGHPSAG